MSTTPDRLSDLQDRVADMDHVIFDAADALRVFTQAAFYEWECADAHVDRVTGTSPTKAFDLLHEASQLIEQGEPGLSPLEAIRKARGLTVEARGITTRWVTAMRMNGAA